MGLGLDFSSLCICHLEKDVSKNLVLNWYCLPFGSDQEEWVVPEANKYGKGRHRSRQLGIGGY